LHLPKKKLVLGTLYMRYFGLTKVPMIFFLRPVMSEWNDEKIVVKIPFARRAKNHVGSMYFGALATGADLAAGFAAMAAIRKSPEPVSLLFKNIRGDFLKRVEGDAFFTCDEVVLVKDLVTKAIETGERVEMPVSVKVTVPEKFGDEAVAKFTLTLSLKRKS
jgi:acyl-coenzyme A thioesterase PaaI-like protein